MIKATDENIRILIHQRIIKNPKADLNDLDVSGVTDMSNLFSFAVFNGDISKWDTSKVIDMSCMFMYCDFCGDISKWNVKGVLNMMRMFERFFIMDVTIEREMYGGHIFHQDLSKWVINKECDYTCMFFGCGHNVIPPTGIDKRYVYCNYADNNTLFKYRLDDTLNAL